MGKDAIIKYALDKETEAPRFIDDVPRGKACNCKCAKCGISLIAAQGDVYDSHFKHDNGADCAGAPETVIHKFAKQIITENREIEIPGGTLKYSQSWQEKRLDGIIPDVTVLSENANVHFEVFVTNPVGKVKKDFYRIGMHKSIEIDLSKIDYKISLSELKDAVLKNTTNKTKIFWEPQTSTESSGGILIGAIIVGFLAWLFSSKDE